jgi:membrane-associated phospholipid phosphatase
MKSNCLVALRCRISPRRRWRIESFRLRRLAARVGTLWALKMLGTAGGIALFFYAYFWAMRHPLGAVTVMPEIWIDRLIGFQPLSFFVYAFLWIYISFGTAIARNLRELVAFGLASLAMSVAGLVVYVLFPTRAPNPAIDWSLYPWLDFLKSVDVAGNAFPSLHASFCVFTAAALHDQLKTLGDARWPRVANGLLCAGILYSTMATRQHVALDVIAGMTLGAVVAFPYLKAMSRIRAGASS